MADNRIALDVFFHLPGLTEAIALSAKVDGLAATLTQQGEQLMATLQEVLDKIAQVGADIVAEKAEVQGALSTLKDQVKALQDQLAAGTGVTSADLDNVLAQLDAIDTGVKAISEPAVPADQPTQ